MDLLVVIFGSALVVSAVFVLVWALTSERDLDAAQLEALARLARQTASHLDLRRRSRMLLDLNEELRRVAVSDALTGLANRRQFELTVAREIDRVARIGEPALLLLADIDHFKRVNDDFGHAAGDRALEILSERMNRNLPADTMLGRLAGDEFALFIENLPAGRPSARHPGPSCPSGSKASTSV